jgi:isopentenyl phosphate kinase
VEAMAKSLVPVTLDYGDVALGAGEEFCVSDYDHMVQRILRLKDDAAYYQSMADKAYQRMKVVTDSAGIFWECFEKIRKLPQFQ